MWHEGAIVWNENGNGNALMPDLEVRNIIGEHQNGQKKDCILKAEPANVAQLTRQAIDFCHGTDPLEDPMWWVCNHEAGKGGRDAINRPAKGGNIPGVRNAFHYYQRFNDNAKNITACYNNS